MLKAFAPSWHKGVANLPKPIIGLGTGEDVDRSSLEGPRVRILFPPALSPLRTSFSGGKRGKVRGGFLTAS